MNEKGKNNQSESFVEICRALSEAEKSLNQDIPKSKALYNKARDLYVSLTNQEKKEVHAKLLELYNRLHESIKRDEKKVIAKKLTQVFLVIFMAIIFLIIIINSYNPSLTGLAVLNENATNNNTIITDTITTTETPSTNEAQTTQEKKEKPDKEEILKPEPNKPPVWKSDVNEFIVKGATTIDLNNYFVDDNNDAITYTSTTPEKISVTINSNLVTLISDSNNFTATIEFTADDGDKTTKKEVALIVPERTITNNLQYKPGTIYDVNDDGSEPTNGVVDLTVENSGFSWNVNESNLCTRWEVYSVEDEKSTTVCYGSDKCCGFVGLGAARDSWKENFYAAYGQYGARLNNIASAQVIYVDYGKREEKPYVEIYY